MTIEAIRAFANRQGLFDFISIERRPDWRGYEVYEPVYEEKNGYPPAIGLPYVILVKGEAIRMSTTNEALEWLADEVKKRPKDLADE